MIMQVCISLLTRMTILMFGSITTIDFPIFFTVNFYPALALDYLNLALDLFQNEAGILESNSPCARLNFLIGGFNEISSISPGPGN